MSYWTERYARLRAAGLCITCREPNDQPNKALCSGCSLALSEKNRKKRPNLLYRYGITSDEYDQLLVDQGGVCAVCGLPETSNFKSRLSVDHNHETGRVRGLLCNTCNRALGLLRDNPEVLRNAASYLENAD
jgi:hypothetical protein